MIGIITLTVIVVLIIVFAVLISKGIILESLWDSRQAGKVLAYEDSLRFLNKLKGMYEANLASGRFGISENLVFETIIKQLSIMIDSTTELLDLAKNSKWKS